MNEQDSIFQSVASEEEMAGYGMPAACASQKAVAKDVAGSRVPLGIHP